MAFWSRTKPLETGELAAHHTLKRTLDWPHLVALGVGAIVGMGIYVLIGEAAGMAGPAVMISFVVVAGVCACVALAYSELATMMPVSGGAYSYSYAALGELAAWIIGWALILEYSVAASAVAVGWAGYVNSFLQSIGLHLPPALTSGPNHADMIAFLQGLGLPAPDAAYDAGEAPSGIVNLPAIVIIFVVAGLLIIGARESANVNNVLVAIKLTALLAFIALAAPLFNAAHFEPFAPYGWGSVEQGGGKVGMMAAAALIFFAFYGFDAVSTAAEEAKNPGRNMVIGIVGSMVVCAALYMAVAAAALGAMRHEGFKDAAAPLAFILEHIGRADAARIISAAVIVAVPSVILALMYGQSRIFFVMSRDGLLPQGVGRVHGRFGTPVGMTIVTALACSALAGFLPLAEIAYLANAGTLAAFTAVAIAMMALRVRQPGARRPFKTPLAWAVGPLAVIGCLYLFTSLKSSTIVAFFCWMGVGLVVYLLYGVRKSALAQAESQPGT